MVEENLFRKKEIYTYGQIMDFLKKTSSLPFLEVGTKLQVIASAFVSVEKRASSIIFADFPITISK